MNPEETMTPPEQPVGMNPEELLKLLRDAGLDDEGIKNLLSDTLASLEGPAEESDAAKAGELLGVEF